MPKLTDRAIFVTVSGGVAYVCDDSVPSGVRVEIIDFDNLDKSPEGYLQLSVQALAYVKEHFAEFLPPNLGSESGTPQVPRKG